jgi:N-formylglutamate amidohydrolase
VNLKPFRFDSNKEKVKERYYNSHHLLLKEIIQRTDNPLIVDCHSFSNEIYPYKVEINNPYKGSLSVNGCPSIMIEINKRLYLSKDCLSKKADFYKIEFLMKTILNKIQNAGIKRFDEINEYIEQNL